uniref:Uncharacterized protein n=1 Tax=Oryza meridionalis TaxID=40149 RepID=A0A0E0CPR0_9ORYZ
MPYRPLCPASSADEARHHRVRPPTVANPHTRRLLRRPRFVATARRPRQHNRVIPHPYIPVAPPCHFQITTKIPSDQSEELLPILGSSVGIEKLCGQPPTKHRQRGQSWGRGGEKRSTPPVGLSIAAPVSHLQLSRRQPLLFRIGRAQAVGGTNEGRMFTTRQVKEQSLQF